MRDALLSQHDKYVAFKTAYQTITYYLAQDNFLAAYVIAFSLIEDRVRAMFVVQHRVIADGKNPTAKQISASFSNIVCQLQMAGDIPQEDANLLLAEAKVRNGLLHSAMWNLTAFDKTAVDRAIKLTRNADKLRRAQKKTHGQ